jgi:hypothetical protein
MYIKTEIDFDYLKDICWSGAVETLQIIEQNNKQDFLIQLLEEIFIEQIPDITDINDFLWFDTETIFEYLNISENEE